MDSQKSQEAFNNYISFLKKKHDECGEGLFLDIGANVGKVTEAVSEACPKFHIKSYEPLQSILKHYADDFPDNVISSDKAVWVESGKELGLYIDTHPTSLEGSSLCSNKFNVGENCVKVETIDISQPEVYEDGCRFSGERPFIAVKLDVEGAEYDLLPYWASNGFLERIDSLAVEWHSKKLRGSVHYKKYLAAIEDYIRETAGDKLIEWY